MLHPDPFTVRALLGDQAAVARRAISGEIGVALPPLADHHVHGHLVDLAKVFLGGIAAVVDLGGDPAALFRAERAVPHIDYAGAFLTAPGGYPAGRAWAPPAIVREIVGSAGEGATGSAPTAVDEQADFGASVIKVALNADAGPVLDADALAAVVARARTRGLPVVAHAQGAGMTRLAVEAGLDALAHTPFTEAVDDALLRGALDRGQVWISTLAIHDGPALPCAVDNLRRFAAAGGRVLYGTDLGNGPQPLGVNAAEVRLLLAADLDGAAVIAALADPWPRAAVLHGVSTFVPGAPPASLAEVPDWLAGARVVPTEELVPDDQ